MRIRTFLFFIFIATGFPLQPDSAFSAEHLGLLSTCTQASSSSDDISIGEALLGRAEGLSSDPASEIIPAQCDTGCVCCYDCKQTYQWDRAWCTSHFTGPARTECLLNALEDYQACKVGCSQAFGVTCA